MAVFAFVTKIYAQQTQPSFSLSHHPTPTPPGGCLSGDIKKVIRAHSCSAEVFTAAVDLAAAIWTGVEATMQATPTLLTNFFESLFVSLLLRIFGVAK